MWAYKPGWAGSLCKTVRSLFGDGKQKNTQSINKDLNRKLLSPFFARGGATNLIVVRVPDNPSRLSVAVPDRHTMVRTTAEPDEDLERVAVNSTGVESVDD